VSNEFAVQTAIYDAVSGDAAVSDLVATVVDFGPTAADASSIYPYVAIGDVIFGEMDTDTTNGFDAVLRVHTWTNTGSAKLCRDIQGAIYDVLHNGDLTIPGFNVINIYREDSDVTLVQSGAHHGVCEYRALLDKL